MTIESYDQLVWPLAGAVAAIESTSHKLTGGRGQTGDLDGSLTWIDQLGNRCIGRNAFVSVAIQVGDLVVVGARQQNSADTGCRRNQFGRWHRTIQKRTTGGTTDNQVFRDDVHDINVVETTGNGQRFGYTVSRRIDANEQTVQRVVDQPVVVDLGTDAIIVAGECAVDLVEGLVKVGFFEAIGSALSAALAEKLIWLFETVGRVSSISIGLTDCWIESTITVPPPYLTTA